MGAVRIRYCRAGCGYQDFTEVFKMEPMPLAGGFTDTLLEAKYAEKIPLTWAKCVACGLVQVLEDVPDDELYRNYAYASSSVGALRDHFRLYAQLLAERFSLDSIRALEIGCNDGVLLNQLPQNWSLWGVDPSDVAWKATNTSNYAFFHAPFSSALDLKGFDLVIASNCLAHITDISAVVEAASQALKPGGEFWVEVHDLESTLAHGQWDTIYHEHKVEYNLQSLCRTIEPHGFCLSQSTKLPLHGGLLRASFRKGEPNKIAWGSFHLFDLLNKLYKERRESELYRKLSTKKNLVAYGASGRATVWFNQFPELEFKAVIDDSPLRQGKYVPGVGWPIVPWSDLPETDCILITAWNYADVIKEQHKEWSGEWLQTWI